MTEPDHAQRLFRDWLDRTRAYESLDFDRFLSEHPAHGAALRAIYARWMACGEETDIAAGESAVTSTAWGGASDASYSVGPLDGLDLEAVRELCALGPSEARYERRGELGKGGMGVVYRVYDRTLGRELAMKVLSREARPHMARILGEAQLTAQLDHPGIVPVHDIGVDRDERVYFTMKLVQGETLGAVFAKVSRGEEGWNQTRAVATILRMCEAVAFAHERGVIHRDLKPSNVMVGRFGQVYVVDWGLARVIGRDVASAARHVDLGRDPTPHAVTCDGDAIGTPSYMPPEQASGRLAEIGPRADVYATGAILYRLLTGRDPYVEPDERLTGWEILDRARRGPPRPAAELSDAPAELLAICDKAMARPVEERYSSMEAVSDDLRAYLEGRAVRAYRTGAVVELRKWVVRNRGLAGALAGLLVVSSTAAIGFATLARSARVAAASARSSEQAERASATRAYRVTELLQDSLASSDPNQGGVRDRRVVDAMEEALRELDAGALRDEPATEAALLNTIGRVLEGNGRPARALELAERSLAIQERIRDGHDHADLAAAHNELARCLFSSGRRAEARPHFEAALEMRRRLFPGDHRLVAVSMNNVAQCCEASGELPRALDLYQGAAAMLRRVADPDDHALPTTLNNIALCLKHLGRLEEAAQRYEEVLAMRRRLVEGDHPDIAQSLNNLGSCLHSLGRLPEGLTCVYAATAMLRRLFPGDQATVAVSLNNLGYCLESSGRPEAVDAYRECLAMLGRLYPDGHPHMAIVLRNLARCSEALGHSEQALRAYLRVLDQQRRLHGEDSEEVARGFDDLVRCYLAANRPDDARDCAERALEIRRKVDPPDPSKTATAMTTLARCLGALGEDEAALTLIEEALAIRRALYEGDHADVAAGLIAQAASLSNVGRDDEAVACAEQAQAMAARCLPGEDPLRVQIADRLATIRARAARPVVPESDELPADATSRRPGPSGGSSRR